MIAKRMLLGLLPWFLFSIVVRRTGASEAGYAAVGAAVLAVALMFWPSRNITVLNGTGASTFLVLGVVALAGPHSAGAFVAHYGRAVAALVLGLVMLGSLAMVPFTETFARASVPERYWRSPVFRAINRRASAGWAVAVLLNAASFTADGVLATHGHDDGAIRLLFGLVVPAALVGAALAWTKRVASEGRTSPAPGAPAR